MTLLFNYSLRVVIREDCPEEVTQLRPKGRRQLGWGEDRSQGPAGRNKLDKLA